MQFTDDSPDTNANMVLVLELIIPEMDRLVLVMEMSSQYITT